MLVYLKQTESTVNEPGSMVEEEAANTAEAKEQITVAADKAEEQGVANLVRKRQPAKRMHLSPAAVQQQNAIFRYAAAVERAPQLGFEP